MQQSASVLSRRVERAQAAFAAVEGFYFRSRYAERRHDPAIADFTFGNPHEMPLQGIVDAIRAKAIPESKDWFAYKTSEAAPQEFLARRMSLELGLPFRPEDVALTAGAFAAVAVAFRLVLDAGDEIVVPMPAWFCYEPMAFAADVAVRAVPLTEDRFDLDLAAIEAAITERTRMVVVNSPHNPTGRIFGREALTALSAILRRAGERFGRPVFILSDEPYRRLRFEGRGFISPAAVHPWTLISYSYGKVLLAPGQRLGYLALSPLMPDDDKARLRAALFAAEMAMGWCFPNAVMQYAVPDLEELSIDLGALTRRRDVLVKTLKEAGYRISVPEGTFYLWGRFPEGSDPERCWDRLAERDVFVMPGAVLGAPGAFRICLTATDEMVAKALPVFAEAVR